MKGYEIAGYDMPCVDLAVNVDVFPKPNGGAGINVNGAVTMAMLHAAALGEESVFLADLTIRHPENDNAELLWHCGPFPYSLKDPASSAKLAGGQEGFYLKKGEITICRFNEADGNYYLFGGEGRATAGPETTGTYVWLETDN